MKKKTQNRLTAWIIWAMQWILMAAACAAFIEFFTGSGWINLFCGVFFVFMSFQAFKIRVQYFKDFTGITATADFLIWLSKQNRRTRRYHGRKIANNVRKTRSNPSKSL